MPRLHHTLALCLWCSSLAMLHTPPASADEESGLRPPQSTGKPSKGGSFWFIPKIPSVNIGIPEIPSINIGIPELPSLKLPSLPRMPSLRGLGWGSLGGKDAESTGSTSPVPLAKPVQTTQGVFFPPEEHSGSGEIATTIPATTPSLQDNPSRWTETRSVVPMDTVHTITPRPNGNSPDPARTYTSKPSSSRKDMFLLSPTHTTAPAPTHRLTTLQTRGYGRTTTQNLFEENNDKGPGPRRRRPSTSAPITTAMVSTLTKTATIIPALVETVPATQPFRSINTIKPRQNRVPTETTEPTVSITLGANEGTNTESGLWQTQPDPGSTEANMHGPVEDRLDTFPTLDGWKEDREPSTTRRPQFSSTTPGGTLDGDEEEKDRMSVDAAERGRHEERFTTTTSSTPLTTGNTLDTDDWLSDSTDGDVTFLPDCNQERSGICNSSDSWASFTAVSRVTPATAANSTATTSSSSNQSTNPFLIPAPPMFVPLHADWNSAMAAWGLAWEAHVYGLGSVFALVTLASALNLLCLPLRCPSGCGYFALVSLFLLAAGCTRAFSLLYDAYGHQGRLASAEASLLLYEAPFPCLTAAFGLVFLLLSMRSRMQLSYSAFQRPCFLACLVLLHFAAAFGPAALLQLYQRRAPLCLFLSLVSRGAFVALALFLSVAYFVFYCYVRADSKHIYHLNNTSPTPAERYNRCPFAESRDWDRAAAVVCLSALFSLACAGLQLYAMLHALGLAGGDELFRPWPWWAFQFSCRVCEVGVCLTLALVVAQPVYCSDHLPQAGSCWTELLAAKSPIIAGSYQWTLSHQEKLAICDSIGHGETECLPLYTLVDERLGSSLNGLELLYHSNRALAYRDLDLDLPGSAKQPEEDDGGGDSGGGGGGATSGGSSLTSDSTADLRPPSPINLRRSIDEALFSEALFPLGGLFGPAFRCSDLALARPIPNGAAPPVPLATDAGLYRTSSCAEMAAPQGQSPPRHREGGTVPVVPPSPSLSTSSSSSCSSPGHWRDSSSSCSLYRPSTGGSSPALCPSANGLSGQAPPSGGSLGHPAAALGGHQGSHLQRRYRTLGSASQESLDLDVSSEADRSVQEEFKSVCREIDALSVCSETIDL